MASPVDITSAWESAESLKDEAGHLVARKQRLFEQALARNPTVVRVRQDGAHHPLGIAARAKDLADAERMLLGARPPLVIEVVQQRDDLRDRALAVAELPDREGARVQGEAGHPLRMVEDRFVVEPG